MIETVEHCGTMVALVIRSGYRANGVEFLTPPEFPQQLACMHHPAGKVLRAHVHNVVARRVDVTQEVLFIKRGKLRVDFYDEDRKVFASRVLEAGDVILLAAGGHGFEVLEEVEMIEVKQGPYLGEKDKLAF